VLEIYSLLNPKVSNYGDAKGGIPEITPEMVAACLGQIPITGPALLVRTMAGDDTCREPLTTALRKHMAYLASLKRWKTGPKFWDYFEGLVRASVHFYVLPDTCKRCKGRGEIVRMKTRVEKCRLCQGAGRKEPREADKAAFAGIPRATWDDTWADRYAQARGVLSEWEDLADRATKRIWWREI